MEAIRASLRLLDRRARRRFGLALLAQITTALLDLMGVVLIGIVGALAASTASGQPMHPRVASAVTALGFGPISSTDLIGLLAGVAAVLFLAKSVINPILIARVFRFLARQQVAVSGRLAGELLARPLTFIEQRSSQETVAALGGALSAATITILVQTVIAVADSALLIVLAIALLVANPVIALGMIVYFGALGIGVHRLLGGRATRWEAERTAADIRHASTVQEIIGSYREITVADRRGFYIDRLQQVRAESAHAAASQQFYNLVPKYAAEAALVLGAFSLAAVLFTTRPAGIALGTFALFLAAATRAMPSFIRLQGAALAIRSASGSAVRAFRLADDLGHPVDSPGSAPSVPNRPSESSAEFLPTLQLSDVTFTYPGASVPAVDGLSLWIGAGDSVALVGRSGAGKSTLADLILGVVDPDSGTVSVGGRSVADAIRRWPGSIAYVPQNVMLSDDSVRNNVALGLPRDVVYDAQVWEALRRAHLADYVSDQPGGLDTQIGERGLRLSGGQRQRLGLARALFTHPRLIVLDEATSSLDAETERAITETLAELDEDVTSVVIAHRLSTVRHADLVVYLEDGKATASGSFDEVCEKVPALQRQAELMGLRPT